MSHSTTSACARPQSPLGRTKPPSAHVDDQAAARIPTELRDAARWIVWKWHREGDRWRKPPCDPSKPRGKQFIDHSDPQCWLSLDAARRLNHRGGDGVGFSLGREGYADLVGVDFDHCLDELGNIINPDVKRLVEALDSYTERTPSGDGLHVWVKGTIPAAGRRKDEAGIEFYAKDRYLTVTGRHLDGTPTGIHGRQKALNALWDELFGDARPKAQTRPKSKPNGHAKLSDDELIEKARRAKDGDKFKALFDAGDTSGYGGDDSAADLALLSRLAFWTNRDAERMETMFGRSALGQRDKWTDRPDYRKRTIAKAIEGCQATYTPVGRNGHANGHTNGHASRLPPGDGATEVLPSVDGKPNRPRFTNAILDKQAGELKHVPIQMPELVETLKRIAGGWPKRIEERLFIESTGYEPIYLDSSTQFLGWLDGVANVYWARGPGMVSQERFYEYVRKFAIDRFKAIERFPHWPPMEGIYYMHPAVNSTREKTLLSRFLDFFQPETPVDRELIKAAVMTLFWGGLPGKRPVFRIDGPENDPPALQGRGTGKTVLVELIAELAGGWVRIGERDDMESLITRLLSSEHGNKRVLRLDNVKALRLSWAALEEFVTSATISGKALYRGEGNKPNLLTLFITMNGGLLSKDLVTRVVVIRLARPKMDGAWEGNVRAFIRDNRWELIGEILGMLADEPGSIIPQSRWPEWERDVLGKVGSYDQCQAVIAERSALLDDDDEKAYELEQFVRRKLETEGRHNADAQSIKITTCKMSEWYMEHTGERKDPHIVSRTMATLPLKFLSYGRTKHERFWLWTGPEAKPDTVTVELNAAF